MDPCPLRRIRVLLADALLWAGGLGFDVTVVSQVCCLREDGDYHEAIAGLIGLVSISEGTGATLREAQGPGVWLWGETVRDERL